MPSASVPETTRNVLPDHQSPRNSYQDHRGHTSCTGPRGSVVTHRGDVGENVHADHRWYGQTPKSSTPVSDAGRRTEARAAPAAGRIPVRCRVLNFGGPGGVPRGGPEAGGFDMRVVRRADHRQGDRATPEMVFAVLPATGLGAVPGGRVGSVRRPGRRATRGGADPGGSQAPGLAASARRPRPSTRRRPDLRPRPGLPLGGARRRPRGVRSPNRRRPGPIRTGATAPPTGVTSLGKG